MVPRYRLDPEIAAVLEPMAATAAGAAPIERGDWRALRERANTNLAFLATLNPPVPGAVSVQRLQITVDDGTDIAARWYKRGATRRPGSGGRLRSRWGDGRRQSRRLRRSSAAVPQAGYDMAAHKRFCLGAVDGALNQALLRQWARAA